MAKTTARWIETAISESTNELPQMPWTRGARRAAWIARRNAPAGQLRANG